MNSHLETKINFFNSVHAARIIICHAFCNSAESLTKKEQDNGNATIHVNAEDPKRENIKFNIKVVLLNIGNVPILSKRGEKVKNYVSYVDRARRLMQQPVLDKIQDCKSFCYFRAATQLKHTSDKSI
jgi:hypothetical protein